MKLPLVNVQVSEKEFGDRLAVGAVVSIGLGAAGLWFWWSWQWASIFFGSIALFFLGLWLSFMITHRR